jgi:two-component system response regulator CpxR
MRRILLVEDENILRDTYALILTTQPYLLDIAENGSVALDHCKIHTYDLILLDLMMPILNGVGFLKQFMPTAPPETRVVVLSNLSSGNELECALKLGAERNVLKSNMSPKQFIALIRYELEAV